MSDEDLRANPYVGLRPFFVEDSLYFYGREQQTAELLAILREQRFLAIVGSSGSGKSSLVRAGLLPGLVGGFLVRDRDRWKTIQIKPGDAPMANLAAGLVAAMGRPADEATALEQQLRDDHVNAAVDFLRAHLDERTNVFVLVDQFEEIFAFRGSDDDAVVESLDVAGRKERARRRAEAAEYVDLMLRLSERRDLPVYVALTMRTDFLGECDLFYGLPEAFNRGRYLVPRLTREQLRDAVECPALLLGATVAPRLLDQVLNALGDRIDRLPVLQHALLRTWDAWHDAGRIGPIDLAHYWKAGGLEDALDQDAEGALKSVDRDATARVFKRLTDTDASQRRVRSPARISELAASSSLTDTAVKAIINEFERNGRSFVHASADGNRADPRVDISHESLIRQWTSLQVWVDEERQSRDTYRELAMRAERRHNRKGGLLQEPELGIAHNWKTKEEPTAGWAARYSRSDGEFNAAIDYLAESVAVRSRELATLELDRYWRYRWAPAIALIVVGLLVLVAPEGVVSLLERTSQHGGAESSMPATVRVRELIWTTADSQVLDWRHAGAFCEALDLPLTTGGDPYHEWRLPTAAELTDIYSTADRDVRGRQLKQVFHSGVRADYLWTTDAAVTQQVRPTRLAVNFASQLLVPLAADDSGTASALCVSNTEGLFGSNGGNAGAVADADRAVRAQANFRQRQSYWLSLASTVAYVGGLLLLYAIVAFAGKRLQRALMFEKTVRRFESAGGRYPDGGVASRPDAVTVHNTVYATTLRRATGWTVDQVIFATIAIFAFFAVMSNAPRVVVDVPGGTPIHGTLVDWRDGEIELMNDAHERFTVTLRPPPAPEFVDIDRHERVATTLPSGVPAQGWRFLTQIVRMSSSLDGEDWYGTFDVAHSDENTIALAYTLDQYRKTRDGVIADLQWRFSATPERVGEEIGKWVVANPPPRAGEIGQRRFPMRTGVVQEVVYPPTNTELAVFMFFVVVAAWLYEVVQVSSRRGATIGMRVAGITRTGLYGEPLSLRRATLFWLCRLGSYLTFGLGFLVQPFSKRWQAVHDRLSSSVVIRKPKPGATFPPPRAADRWLGASGMAVTVVIAVMVGLATSRSAAEAVAQGFEPDGSWAERWENVGLEFQLTSLDRKGEALRVPSYSKSEASDRVTFFVDPGASIEALLIGALTITPLPKCPWGGCPVGFTYGWDQSDNPDAVTTVHASCTEPVLLASREARGQPFTQTLTMTAPTKPGRYRLWIDFPKLPGCGADESRDMKAHLLTFEVNQ